MGEAVQQLISLGVGANVLHKNRVRDLPGAFDLPPQKDGAAAHKYHRAGFYFQLPFPQSAEQIVHELLRLPFHQSNDLRPQMGVSAHQDGVDL